MSKQQNGTVITLCHNKTQLIIILKYSQNTDRCEIKQSCICITLLCDHTQFT